MWYVALAWHTVEFARLQHPAMWYVALGSWHWFARWNHPAMWQVATGSNAMEFAPTSAIFVFYIWFRFRPSPQSTCHSASVYEILSKSDHPRQKKMTSCRFSRRRKSAILDFRGPIMGSLKSPRTTSYRSSTDIIALNCLVFEKIAFLPCDAMHSAAIAVTRCLSVRPSVRPSVTSWVAPKWIKIS